MSKKEKDKHTNNSALVRHESTQTPPKIGGDRRCSGRIREFIFPIKSCTSIEL